MIDQDSNVTAHTQTEGSESCRSTWHVHTYEYSKILVSCACCLYLHKFSSII